MAANRRRPLTRPGGLEPEREALGRPRLAAVLTDLGYLLAAAFPALIGRTIPYHTWRYRRLSASYDSTVVARSPRYTGALRSALAQVSHPVRCAADVGAGTGAATREVRARFPQARLIALDLSPTMLARLNSPGAIRVVGRVDALPLRRRSLDLIVIQNAPPDFSELMSAVRPDGILIFSLSAGARVPIALRRWLLARALPASAGPPREVVAGNGVSWVVRRRARSSG